MEDLLQTLQALLQALPNSIPPLNDQAPQALNIFVFFVQWAATILAALAGLYQARRYGMDFYGSLVIGFVVSVGGGTIRDLLLGRDPVFWVTDPAYLITVIAVVILAVLIGRKTNSTRSLATEVVQLAQTDSRIYVIVDALGLGLWAYLGAFYSIQMGAPPAVAPVMGTITASFGGVLRDVFFARVPQSFMPGQLYAAAAAVGAIAYVSLWWLGIGEITAFLACFVLTFAIRIASVRFNIQSR